MTRARTSLSSLPSDAAPLDIEGLPPAPLADVLLGTKARSMESSVLIVQGAVASALLLVMKEFAPVLVLPMVAGGSFASTGAVAGLSATCERSGGEAWGRSGGAEPEVREDGDAMTMRSRAGRRP